MQVQIKQRKLEAFIDEQVRAGHFRSADEVIAAAVAQMMSDHVSATLTDDDIAAIEDSDRQIDHGECVDFDAYSAAMKNKYGKE